MAVIESSAMNGPLKGRTTTQHRLHPRVSRDLRAGASDAFGMEDDSGQPILPAHVWEVEAPEYAYDREAARNHRRQAIQAERARLKNAQPERCPREHAGADQQVGAPTPPVRRVRAPSDPRQARRRNQGAGYKDASRGATQGRSSLFNRRRKPKDKKSNDLFNPDDEDYF